MQKLPKNKSWISMSLMVLVFSSMALVACKDYSGTSRLSGSNGGGGVGTLPPAPVNNPFPAGQGFENPNRGEFTEQKMLVNIGVNVISPAAKQFLLEAQNLKRGVQLLCSALERAPAGANPSNSEWQRAQRSWQQAMLAYHRFAAVPVGPLQDNNKYLADNLYSWPYFNACGVDQEVVRVLNTGRSNPQKLFTVKGLRALEYLLFSANNRSACNLNLQPGVREWLNRSERERMLDRCNYSLELASEVVELATLADRYWDPNFGNFSKTLIDGSRYGSPLEAINAVSDGLFQFEILKDQKLGRPLGRHADCARPSCPESVEHPWSGISLPAAKAQIEAFQAVFFGDADPDAQAFGFDDLLAREGRSDVAARLRAHLAQAEATRIALDSQGNFEVQIRAMDPAQCRVTSVSERLVPLCGFYSDIRAAATVMKIDVLAALRLRAPAFIGPGDLD